MIRRSKLKFVSTILIILFMQLSALAYAAQGGEQGSSPGIPGKKPLSLSSVTLAGGGNVQNATDIPTEPQFILEFDKNVVNSVIWEGNSKCFSLISADKEAVPVRVTKIDDTIDVTQRQNIFVQPVKPLRPGTAYYLQISPELKGKNGVTLGGTNSEGISISFKTKGEAATQSLENANRKPTGTTDIADVSAASANSGIPKGVSNKENEKQQQITSGEEKNSGEVSVAAEQGLQEADDKPKETKGYFPGGITTIGIFLVAGWIAWEMLSKRKAKKK